MRVQSAVLCLLTATSALAAEKKIKVASIFATPIEEPWDHQIHVALLKAEKELGYSPKISLEEGMRRSIAWCIEQGIQI